MDSGSKGNLAGLHRDVCVAGEAVTVAVQLTNPLGIPLLISRLSLLAHLQPPDDLPGPDGSILVCPGPPASPLSMASCLYSPASSQVHA